MALVLVERSFEQPVRLEDSQKLEDDGSWCLEAHGVRFLKAFLSRDRTRMLCMYEAADAEAVRMAEQQAKVPFDCAWTCQIIQNPDPSPDVAGKVWVVVERTFASPVTLEYVSNVLCAGSWCLDLHRTAHIESFLGKDGLKMV